MSKYLIKILSICAFVVLLPLIITATALTVTETRAFSLSVDISGNTNERYSASVLINDKEENKFTSIKNTNVELTFVADAYDFIGWFKGSKTPLKKTMHLFQKKINLLTILQKIVILLQYVRKKCLQLNITELIMKEILWL